MHQAHYITLTPSAFDLIEKLHSSWDVCRDSNVESQKFAAYELELFCLPHNYSS